MNTIQRLGERETVDRIINGILKSYVDRDIDTADTSEFNNLEVLNVPKAESVVIGEGVKDTLTVLTAPKAEEVVVDTGEKGMVVNWGKCGGTDDVIVTYKEGEGIWIPETFFGSGTEIRPTNVKQRPSTLTETPQLGRVATFHNGYNPYSWISVYRIPQELGKWLYDNAESVTSTIQTAYSYSSESLKLWKAWAYYPSDVPSNLWTLNQDSKAWKFALRKGSDIGIRCKDYNGNILTSPSTLGDLTETFKSETTEWAHINPNDYYIVAEISTESYIDAFGYPSTTSNVYLRHWNTLSTLPTASAHGESVKAPSELCTPIINNNLNNLPNLKVADVHSADVDVPMFKGCTSLEKATIGGKKNPTEVEGVMTYPTLDSSYFEGCTNLSEVTITNPELRFNNAIPLTVDLYADDSKLPSDGLLEYSKYGFPPVMVTMATYLQANNSGYRVKGAEQIDYPQLLGGKIFYIDPSDNGATYTFYDESGNKVNATTFEEINSKAKYYVKTGTSTRDKFYVLYDSIDLTNRSYTYKDNGSNVYEDLFDDSVDCYGIGKGKSNTLTIMNIGGGYTSTTTTIWYYCKSKNDSVTNGYSDWYIPSDDELGALYNSGINQHWFTSRYIPSSSEHIGEQNKACRIWYNGASTFVNKSGGGNCVLIRSF